MSRSNKNRKKLPKWTQKMYKGRPAQYYRSKFIEVDYFEYGVDQDWCYRPLSRHLENISDWDVTSFYRNKVNYKFDDREDT